MINFIRAKFRNQREINTSSTAVLKPEKELPNSTPIDTVSLDEESEIVEKDTNKNFEETEQPNLIESTKNSIQIEENVVTDEDEIQAEPNDYHYGGNSDEDSDPYGYREEMLGLRTTYSDDDY